MVRKNEHCRFQILFCECRPSLPYRGKQIPTHKRKCASPRIGEYRICLKDLCVLKAPFDNAELEQFYATHADCSSGKVTSPRAKQFFASLFASEYVKEREDHMMIALEDEVEEGEEDEEGDSEEEEEAEEEEERELASAVNSIREEFLAPSLGEPFEEAMKDMDEWLWNQNATHSPQTMPQTQESMPQTHETTSQQPTIETNNQTTLPETSRQHSTTEASTSHQILIPAHNSQTQTIINLKDRLSREQKLHKDALKQIEILENKLKTVNKNYHDLKSSDEARKMEEEALNRARNVLNTKFAKVERRENVVKEIDERFQREKKEMWQQREKLDAEKELVRTEWEKMKDERVKMEAEKKKVQEESEKMRAREDEIKCKRRSLMRLFEVVKEESRKAEESTKESKSLIHVPLQNGLIAGDPSIQAMPIEVQECFNIGACGHIKVVHKGALSVTSWHNKKQKRNITNLLNGSDSEGEETPAKKSRT